MTTLQFTKEIISLACFNKTGEALLAESDVLFAGPISTSWRPIPKTMGIWRKGCSLLPSCSTHPISVSSVLEL